MKIDPTPLTYEVEISTMRGLIVTKEKRWLVIVEWAGDRPVVKMPDGQLCIMPPDGRMC